MKKLCILLTVILFALMLPGCSTTDKPDSKAERYTRQSSIEVVSGERSGLESDSSADASGDPSEQQSEQSSESSLSDEDKKMLDDMHKAEQRLEEVLSSDEYKNADEDHKRELANKVLSELVDEGYIIKDSVLEDDQNISFTYRGGILGGISLRGFDPYMN